MSSSGPATKMKSLSKLNPSGADSTHYYTDTEHSTAWSPIHPSISACSGARITSSNEMRILSVAPTLQVPSKAMTQPKGRKNRNETDGWMDDCIDVTVKRRKEAKDREAISWDCGELRSLEESGGIYVAHTAQQTTETLLDWHDPFRFSHRYSSSGQCQYQISMSLLSSRRK